MVEPRRQAVFIDRDGVINRTVLRNGHPAPPSALDELELVPGVAEALETLHRGGFLLIVVTNQPDVATGAQRAEVVESIHERLRRRLPIDDIKVCYHVDEHGCACRKPKPGMLLEAAREWSVSLSDSFMVGDRWRDIEAGRAANCTTILVGTGYGELQGARPDVVVGSLLEASVLILSKGRAPCRI